MKLRNFDFSRESSWTSRATTTVFDKSQLEVQVECTLPVARPPGDFWKSTSTWSKPLQIGKTYFKTHEEKEV